MNASGEVVSFPLLRACVFQDMSAAAPVEMPVRYPALIVGPCFPAID
jgi:hypothetical protein